MISEFSLERHFFEEKHHDESNVDISTESEEKESKKMTECFHPGFDVFVDQSRIESETLSNNVLDRQHPQINVVDTDVSTERPTVDTNSTSIEKLDDEICAMRLATDLVSLT